MVWWLRGGCDHRVRGARKREAVRLQCRLYRSGRVCSDAAFKQLLAADLDQDDRVINLARREVQMVVVRSAVPMRVGRYPRPWVDEAL